MSSLRSCFFIALFILIGCDSQKKVVESKVPEEQKDIVDPETDLALAGAVNFEDEESLTIYSAILKNVIGDKPGAYIGHKMDKLASELENKLSYTDLLRAGEGLILEFNNKSELYFDSGKTNLNESSKNALLKILTVLNNYPGINLIVETHTDSSGDEEVNMKMTTERATSIENYFVENNLDQDRLKIKAFGESQPRYKNDTEENRKKNRRVEFGFYASDELKAEAKNMTQ
jgi:outer membrane protein OmpA-like peptidoglycan-associated protein